MSVDFARRIGKVSMFYAAQFLNANHCVFLYLLLQCFNKNLLFNKSTNSSLESSTFSSLIGFLEGNNRLCVEK